MGFYQPHNCIYTYMHSIRQIIIVRLRYIITFHATASYETMSRHCKTTHVAYAKGPKTTKYDVQELHANMQIFPQIYSR